MFRFLLPSLALVAFACGEPSHPTLPQASSLAPLHPVEALARTLPCPSGHARVVDRQVHCERADGVAEGAFAVVGQTGRVRLEGEYREGVRTGAFASFWDSGAPQQTGRYEGGDTVLRLPDGTRWIERKNGNIERHERVVLSSRTREPRTILKPQGVLDDGSVEPAQHMLSLASDQGEYRVIVGVRAAFEPEATLAPVALEAQRRSIRTLQEERVRRIEQQARGKLLTRFETIPYLSLVVDADGLAELLLDPDVTSIEPDRLSRPMLETSTALIGATTLWEAGTTGEGWTVAVLDSGVEKTHPFLANKVTEEACYSNASGRGGGTTLCPNGQSTQTTAGAGVACSSSLAGCAHGTHVAGIVAGRSPARSGVAKDANVFAIQVFTKFTRASDCGDETPPCIRSYSTDQIAALERVYARRSARSIAAVNMSLGGGKFAGSCDTDNSALKAQIDNLRAAGIPTVIASGNEGYDGFMSAPACITTAVSVGSTTKGDAISYFSNHSSRVTLLAPGDSIYSSVLDGGYGYKSGTSMATPHVAGAFALLRQALPDASVGTLVDALRNTGKPVERAGVSRPRIRVADALESITIEPPVFSPPPSAFTGSVTVTLTTPTPGASIRYTTDGSDPSASRGTLIFSGQTVTLARATTLKACAFKDGHPVSKVTTGVYSRASSLQVNLAPSDMPAKGARWRVDTPLTLTFDDALSTQFDFRTTETGPWQLDDSTAASGRFSLRSGPTDHGAQSVLQTTFETSGGIVEFKIRVSSEKNYDRLAFFIGDGLYGDWSGDVDWQTVSYPVDPGTRTLTWVYLKDTSQSSGADAAWIDDLVLPGDEWRESGDVLAPLPEGDYPLAFKAVADWTSPPPTVVRAEGTTEPFVATYTRTGTVQVTLEPSGARTAGAKWRVGAGAWRQSGESLALTPGRYTVDFQNVAAWTPPLPVTIDVSRDQSVSLGATYVQRQVAAPLITPNGGTLSNPTPVVLSTSTEGASIRFTLDGSPVTPSSTLYQGPFTLDPALSERVRARAYKNGWLNSEESVAEYAFAPNPGTVAAPLPSLPPGTFVTAQQLAFTSTTPGALIRYTLDGTVPTVSAPAYTAPIPLPLDSTTYVWARAFHPEMLPSDMTGGVYRVTGEVATPTVTPGAGEVPAGSYVVLQTATPGALIRYTLDGSAPTEAAALYSLPLVVDARARLTLRARAYKDGWTTSGELSAVFTGAEEPLVEPPLERLASPLFTPSPGLFTQALGVTIQSPSPTATVRYTTDGTLPTETSPAYNAPVALATDSVTPILARAFEDGFLPSEVSGGVFRVTGQVATPAVTPNGGQFEGEALVVLLSDTPGATVRYTLDGSEPTESSARFDAPLTLREDTLLRARAYREGWIASEPIGARFTFTESVDTNPTPAPPRAPRPQESGCASTSAGGLALLVPLVLVALPGRRRALR